MDFQSLSKFDLLGRNIDKNTPFFITLLGARSAIKRFLGLDKISLPIIQDNNVKAALRQAQGASDNVQYPYAYLSFTNIRMIKEQQAVKNVRRVSMGHVDNGTNGSVTKFYGFPIEIELELHFITADIFEAVNFALKALTMTATEAMSFDVEDSSVAWKVRVASDSDSISFPKADKDNEVDPNSYDMVVNFKVNGWTGVHKEVAKINNHGRVTSQVGVIKSNGEVELYGDQ